MSTTLKSIQAEIEALQAEYRATSSLNRGMIRGAVDTADIGERITRLMGDYNARSKRTMYSGGRIVPRNA